ncbi:SDR family NAD(P)-dependent oxidoreductase [Allopusillimonas soli]|uniref:SDR family NAD(P)-dependent oxidoreductase n=1 Tax=Allopusillimonas soli TaxID=659016 RepID=A0A853F770_9BURK|nr:type I polyketide synthase [Allopusillimonas soli]NYT36434.1 SDR family NAD(P)-dependent oxidoreductase [Allopusillimonas soli]TEA74944.1 SDR family NAD(P)-dependent oxidoreductase [Allopusillimonas soli]
MGKKVAVIGLSFRLPDTDARRYWPDLLQGRDLVTQVDSRRFDVDAFLHPSKSHPGTSYTFAAGSIGDVSLFDPEFFGISPREASYMDPQQRLLLQLTWEAMEHAGIPPAQLRGSDCAVYVGISSNEYSYRMADDMGVVDSSMATGNTASIAANRISYVFDLRGPSMSVDTACSSSLVAFHQACQSIRCGESGLAIAGGINLHLHPYGFIGFSKASMLSPRGRCRVFDASGDGYVRSEGGGLFLLKDYEQALADGDHILAVVAGSGVNTDGRKTGLTVPRCTAQAELIRHTMAQAGLTADDVDYLEAHGTGTAVGDPIESRAIGMALGQERKHGALPIGSVKSNMGHLETGSGVAGLVKAIYSLRTRTVPATIGVETPNPNIKLDEWNIRLVTENMALPAQGRLTIGVNSFGFGGSNAHVIVQTPEDEDGEAADSALPSRELGNVVPLSVFPGAAPASDAPTPAGFPLLLSARSAQSLKDNAAALAAHMRAHPDESLYDTAYHAAFRREWLDQRAVVFAHDKTKAADALEAFAAAPGDETADVITEDALPAANGPVFVYSGNGSQWEGMGQRLMGDPVFAQAINEVDALFSQYAGYSLREELVVACAPERFAHTDAAQPALFALQVGMTHMLRAYGVTPVAVIGHSVGEVAAAWASGALSLEQATRVIYERSRWQETTRGQGQMTAVALGAAETAEILAELEANDRVALAGDNSPKGCTLAGNADSLDAVEARLQARNVRFKRLGLDYAFHSAAMDGFQSDLLASLQGLVPAPAEIPMYSTVVGGCINGEMLDADYWWKNIRQPVLFNGALTTLVEEGRNLFVEIGPHAVLTGYVREVLRGHESQGRVLDLARRDDDDPQRVRKSASRMLLAGGPESWEPFFPRVGRFVDLPTYAWRQESYWHPVTPESRGLLARHKVHDLLGYPVAQQACLWENELDTLRYPNLGDHALDGAVVMPGSGYAEMVLACALQAYPDDLAEIEEMDILAPLILGAESAKRIRTHLEEEGGRVTIQSKPLGADQAWTPHATARVLQEPTGLFLDDGPLAIPDREADDDAAGHLSLTAEAGLTYGPAFQVVSKVWYEDADTVLGELAPPESIQDELTRMHLHPALLDGGFQLVTHVIKDDPYATRRNAFVPVKIERLVLRRDLGVPRYIRVNMRARGPRSLRADFSVYDAQGMQIAALHGVRFRSVALQKQGGIRLDYLDYVPTPRPLAGALGVGTDAGALDAMGLEQGLQAFMASLSADAATSRFIQEVDPLLDSLAASFAADGTDEAGDEPSPQDIWNALLRDYPEYALAIFAIGRAGLHGTALQRGELTASAVKPRELTPSALLRLVFGGAARVQLTAELAAQISQAQAGLKPGRRLRVMEIACGEPLLAADCCARIDPGVTDYAYACPDADMLESVVWLRDQHPDIDLIHIDATAPGAENAAVSGQRDLILIWGDFSSQAQADAVLRHARANLAPGGLLLLCGAHRPDWCAASLAGDTIAATGCFGYANPEAWQTAIRSHGLTAGSALVCSSDTPSGPFLLLARADALAAENDDAQTAEQVLDPAAVTAKEAAANAAVPSEASKQDGTANWFLLADAEGCSASLAQALQLRLVKQNARISDAASAEELAALLSSDRRDAARPTHIVLLAGLGLGKADATVDWQTRRCALAASVVQACEHADVKATLWVIASQGSAWFMPLAEGGNAPALDAAAQESALGDAALWGYARSLMNEPGHCTVRAIDLPALDAANAESLADELVLEFLQPDAEQEVVLSATGARMAPRLRMLPAPRPAGDDGVAATTEPEAIQLGFEFSGQLRNLRWEAVPLRDPVGDEMEIEVLATGLNFRDVMYTMGMLSDEAVENGFAGPSLGLEFAGRVLRVGPEAGLFRPGDNVVGFGPHSFATRMLTQSSAVSLMPDNMSFEAAATVPSVFFTVYYAMQHLARLEAGERVLIHGAAGGVGIAAIQLAQHLGAEIHATAGSDEKRDFLRLLGVTHIYDSRSLSFADEILQATGGEGVDVVLNSLAGEAINRNLRVLKPFGRFLELGKRDFYQNTHVGLRPFRNNISYFGIDADQLMRIKPDLTRRLFREVMDLFEQGVLAPLPYRTFDANEVEDAFRYMQQARQIGKIVVNYRHAIRDVFRPAAADTAALSLPADASYLVTGGLGGFGLRTAQWLVDKGARHLILLSRRGPTTDEACHAIEALRARDVEVYATACDVTDRAALAQVLEQAGTAMPPLKGVVHAATVIDDGLARQMDADQIRRVLAPKILGALHLDRLTRDLALDFFVLYSSATTVFGNPGQSNYVAANAWLEALAGYRRTLDLPAICVRWGAIDDVGFLARNEKVKEALQNRMGGSALPSSLALKALEAILLADASGLAVMEMDWKPIQRFMPAAGSPKFSDVARRAADTQDDDGGEHFAHLMETLDDETLDEHVQDLIKGELANILRLPAARIDAHKSVYDMGLDSLLGVELMLALESRFGVRLPVMTLGETPTVAGLSGKLIAMLRGETTQEDAGLQQQVAHLTSQHVVDVSADDIKAFTEDMASRQAGASKAV